MSADEKVGEAVAELREYLDATNPDYHKDTWTTRDVDADNYLTLGTLRTVLSELDRLTKAVEDCDLHTNTILQLELACTEYQREVQRLRSAPPLFAESDVTRLQGLSERMIPGGHNHRLLRDLASRISESIRGTGT